jgi:hypothetical protein
VKLIQSLSACLFLGASVLPAQEAAAPASPELEKAIQRNAAAKQQLANLNAEITSRRAELQGELQPLEEQSEELRRELAGLQREAENFR